MAEPDRNADRQLLPPVPPSSSSLHLGFPSCSWRFLHGGGIVEPSLASRAAELSLVNEAADARAADSSQQTKQLTVEQPNPNQLTTQWNSEQPKLAKLTKQPGPIHPRNQPDLAQPNKQRVLIS